MDAADQLAGAAAGWAALGVLVYLGLGVAAAAAAQRRARSRRWAERVLLLYPAFVRVAVRGAAVAALGVAAAPVSSAFATPSDSSAPRPPVVAPQRPGAEPLDWPVRVSGQHAHVTRANPTQAQPDLAAHPHLVGPPGPASKQLGQASASGAYVTVEAGDCLWSLAASAIGPHAAPAQVASAWPHWWHANRALVGSDPNLLRPGLQLRVPGSAERSAS